jgi:hypothetical protein
MKILDFDSYHKMEEELKNKHRLLLNKVSEYILFNEDFRNKNKLMYDFKIADIFYDSLRDYYAMNIYISNNYTTNTIYISKKDYEDINKFIRNPNKYKLEKQANKFNL